MNTEGDRRRSIEEILAEARAKFERVEPSKLAEEYASGALIIDIRPAEQRSRDGPLTGAIIIDRNVLEWRLDPSCPHHIAEAADHDTR